MTTPEAEVEVAREGTPGTTGAPGATDATPAPGATETPETEPTEPPPVSEVDDEIDNDPEDDDPEDDAPADTPAAPPAGAAPFRVAAVGVTPSRPVARPGEPTVIPVGAGGGAPPEARSWVHHRFLDENTGEPVEGVLWEVWFGKAKLAEGVTGADGMVANAPVPSLHAHTLKYALPGGDEDEWPKPKKGEKPRPKLAETKVTPFDSEAPPADPPTTKLEARGKATLLRRKDRKPREGTDHEVQWWSQGNPKFNSGVPLCRKYSTGDQATRDICKCGCGLVALAMVLATAGLRAFRAKGDGWEAGDPIDPRNLADFFIDVAEREHQKNVWKIFRKNGGALNWTTTTPDASGWASSPKDGPLAKALRLLVKLNTGEDRADVGYRILAVSKPGKGGKGAAPIVPGDDVAPLVAEIDRGRPVLFLGNHGPRNSGHFTLIVGYVRAGEKTYFYMNDPCRRTAANPYKQLAANEDIFRIRPVLPNELFHAKNAVATGGPYTVMRRITVITGIDDLLGLEPWSPASGEAFVVSAVVRGIGGTPLAGQAVEVVDPDTKAVVAGPIETDHEGRFTAEVPEKKEYEVRLVDDDVEGDDAAGAADDAGEAGDDPDRDLALLFVRLLDRAGAPLANEPVRVAGPGGAFEARTDRDGDIEVHVKPGAYDVTVRNGLTRKVHTLFASDLEDGDDPYEIVIPT